MVDNVVPLFGAHRPLPRAADRRWVGISDDELTLIDMADELILLASRLANHPTAAACALALAAAHLAHPADIPAAGTAALAERLATTIHNAMKDRA